MSHRLLTLFVGWLALVPSVRAEAEDVLILVAFGDSTTARRETVERVWPERVAERLEAAGLSTFVVDSGRPGNTTIHTRARASSAMCCTVRRALA